MDERQRVGIQRGDPETQGRQTPALVETLEQLTGITAVNSDKAPAIVRF
jgi:hypothetical protein